MTPTASLRPRLLTLYAVLLAANLAAWAWALIAFRHYPLLLGTALLAYGFGLRHAVDADHIAAIDAVTRKLMQTGQRPLGVGLAFSLGHSSIVILATLGIAWSAHSLHGRFESFKAVGATLGTLVSATFLLVLAAVNLVILRDVWRRYRHVQRQGEAAVAALHIAQTSAPGGLLARALRPLFRLVTRSWHMYPVGVLFGLGFDTATEIGLLAIAASEAGKGLPLYSILVFPALFTAGMTLVDSTDNVLMIHAYGWAMDDPKRKLYYNASITFVSAMVAIVIGGVEALRLLSDSLGLNGGVWDAVTRINDQFGVLGYGIVAAFIACWIGSVLFHRWRRPATAMR
ncbi:HoxN/HupN/NixA family nickel/cobalt transporter [bacterium M00.F.Ca.ET.228.01.1.1]|uniref:HoxN/HupN/NixA family nickel/cobalt transporter n=1 Tax=Paraburkholderia phenoliruptrix TaxID=252970 RepID=UPI0010927794|nr:HoxN/HupN/NixA family nickel/cobalt transporter [Paraburkholderia phenoliruptrix]TGP43998.1 HoxN/HupN/NixA family nickel/cobalt transporter [bacterium M00.F.Ca.ET.228.01.1.1]TGS01661.1 HoxN/HupN/NixA family nickel/cobalt transporter [bacterium M00.F.Ca.ET.191.01.1.1]TGU08734.1 HoxN/HupN/NixA family nickel/cobalt transporter [bacterium M00.F.Ca.ET.155.01.1.1]MBW0451233.1 HoxN/HupN/NixA family nickel/cobalt transporter [Paraburkholderia phenoliruptrix]MBW9097334.1 HoxN/HupN/NixA family nickel